MQEKSVDFCKFSLWRWLYGNTDGKKTCCKVLSSMRTVLALQVTGTPYPSYVPSPNAPYSVKKALASAYPWYGAVPGCPSRFRRYCTLPSLLRITPTKKRYAWLFLLLLVVASSRWALRRKKPDTDGRWQAGPHRVPISTQMAR